QFTAQSVCGFATCDASKKSKKPASSLCARAVYTSRNAANLRSSRIAHIPRTNLGCPMPRNKKAQNQNPGQLKGERWAGTPSEVLQTLTQKSCYCRNRRVRFGGNNEDVLLHGTDGMCGMLVGEMHRFLDPIKGLELPTREYIAEKVVGVNPGTFGHFL